MRARRDDNIAARIISSREAVKKLVRLPRGNVTVNVAAPPGVLTSPDGVSWTARSSTVANNLRSVIWTGSQFVATGSSLNSADAPVLTSSDGVTWTLRTSGLRDWDLSNIAWSGMRLCVVGEARSQPAPKLVLTSADGVSWSQQNVVFPSHAQYLLNVIWANGKFVAVGPPEYIATSTDGLTWQAVASSNLGLLYAVAWSGSTFVTAGWDINTSPDGASWARIIPLPLTVWGVVWGQDKYVAIGDDGLIMTSP